MDVTLAANGRRVAELLRRHANGREDLLAPRAPALLGPFRLQCVDDGQTSAQGTEILRRDLSAGRLTQKRVDVARADATQSPRRMVISSRET